MINDGYMKNISKKYNLDIPSEIVSLIFMFYFIKAFNIEHGGKIKIEHNVITNIDETFLAFIYTTVIVQCMIPDGDINHIHSIKVRIIKLSSNIQIGIVPNGYALENAIATNKGYSFKRDGICVHRYYIQRMVDEYITGDIVSLTLNLKEMSLSYKIINRKNKDNVTKEGIVFEAGEIDKTEYKWAIVIDRKDDCVEIIDVY